MGFLDKLKDAGKAAAKGALIMAARPYGMVVDGKHKLCKVTLNGDHSKLMMIKVAEIEAEYTIAEDIKTFVVTLDDHLKGQHWIRLEFNSGETSTVSLTVNQEQGSGKDSPAERVAAHYKDMATFLHALVKHVPSISEEAKQFVDKIDRFTAADTSLTYTIGVDK